MTSSLEVTEKLPVWRNRRLGTILFGAVVALASFAYFSRYCSDALFSSDAADYVRAAKAGFAASYFETRSVGLWGSIRVMKQHPEARLHLWDLLQQQDDDAAPRRHWHVAPGLYGAAIASQFGAPNRTYRLIMAAAGAVAIAVVYIGLRLAGVHFLLALVTAALSAVSPAVVYTSSNVAPHAPFLAALIASGFAFAQYLEKGGRTWGIATGVALGFAVAACELSIMIFAAFGLILAWRAFRSGIKSVVSLLPMPSIAWLATLLLLWPGGVIRGSYVLSYGAWCTRALFVRNDFGAGSPSASEILTRAAQGSTLVLFLFVVIVIGVLVLELTRKSSCHIQVFSWLVLGFLAQGVINRFRNPTYAAHFVVLTWALLALISQQWVELAKGRAHYALLAAVCGMYLMLAIPASGWPAASARATEEERARAARMQEVILFAQKRIPQGATILANSDYDMLGLYLTQNVVQHSMSAFTLQPRPWVNMPGDYWIIANPMWLSSDWRGRLRDLSPSDSASGFIFAHMTN